MDVPYAAQGTGPSNEDGLRCAAGFETGWSPLIKAANLSASCAAGTSELCLCRSAAVRRPSSSRSFCPHPHARSPFLCPLLPVGALSAEQPGAGKSKWLPSTCPLFCLSAGPNSNSAYSTSRQASHAPSRLSTTLSPEPLRRRPS